MIVGVGIDVVLVVCFVELLDWMFMFVDWLFIDVEWVIVSGVFCLLESLVVRFVVKEVLVKVFGVGGGMVWMDVEVVIDDVGCLLLVVCGTVVV